MKKCWLILAALAWAAALSARPYFLLFGSEDCDECASIKELWGQREPSAEAPVLVFVSVDRDENYLFLRQVEQRLKIQRPGNAFPVVLAGRRMEAGYDGFLRLAAEFPSLLADAPRAGLFAGPAAAADAAEGLITRWDAQPPKAPKPQTTAASAPQSPPKRLFYLYATGCAKCNRQEKELSVLAKAHPEVAIDRHENTTEAGRILAGRLRAREGVAATVNLAPSLAWAGGWHHADQQAMTAEELWAKLQSAQGEAWWTAEITDAEREALKRSDSEFLKHATFWTTLSAGLGDGVNPCAFATVIFLISYLLYLKRGRRYVLGVGLCFCIGVFGAYLAFGVGLSFLVERLNRFAVVRQIVYGLFALVGLVLAALHLRDALRFRRSGKASDMEMGLNAGTHRKIHDQIHRWAALTGWVAFPGAVVLGCVVSSMEFVCTGQVYLPMIIAINRLGFGARAFSLLLLYNVAFIVPLVAVTILAYYGVGANALAKWAREHVFATKVAMAVLFLAMGILMAAMIFWS